MQNSTSKAGLRGIHAVGGGVAWASGTNGAVLRTEDGGYMWQSCAMPPGAEKLDFRGIWAWDANTAVVMSSGPGELSRLYRTTDGCSSWLLMYMNPDKDGFWDAVQFWDKTDGVIFGDPIDGIFTVVKVSLPDKPSATEYADYKELRPSKLKFENAGAFAASNSSMALGARLKQGDGTQLWLGTGGKDGAKILRRRTDGSSAEGGGRWTSTPVPLASGTDSSGVFSLAFRDQHYGIAAGGDYKKPNEPAGTAAYSSDGGKTWRAATKPPHGYRSAVAWDAADKVWIAAGTNGSDVSYDDGKTWVTLDTGNWNALSLPWVVGPEGRIAKLVSLKSAVSDKK